MIDSNLGEEDQTKKGLADKQLQKPRGMYIYYMLRVLKYQI